MCTCGHAVSSHYEGCALPGKCRRCVCYHYEVALELGAWPMTEKGVKDYTGLTAAQLVKVIP